MNDRFIRLSISLARLQKVIQRIKASGMSRIELKAGHTLVLCRLAAVSEGLHFSELTERCGLDPAMISRVLAELVRSGLVEKRAESGKYNALYLLTNAGHDRAARVGAVVADIERRADEGIDADDLATFYKVLDQLTRNLEAVDADPAEAFEPLEIQECDVCQHHPAKFTLLDKSSVPLRPCEIPELPHFLSGPSCSCSQYRCHRH